MNIKINFYGAFRKYVEHETLDFSDGGSVKDLKNILAEYLSEKVPDFSDVKLIHDSAIACNDMIVDADYKVQAGETVCILPPVCGG